MELPLPATIAALAVLAGAVVVLRTRRTRTRRTRTDLTSAGMTGGGLTRTEPAEAEPTEAEPAEAEPGRAGRAHPPGPACTLPAPGDTVQVRSHFRAGGGYVDHQGLLLWAAPAGGRPGDAFTPGRACTVVEVHTDGDHVDLAVAVPGSGR